MKFVLVFLAMFSIAVSGRAQSNSHRDLNLPDPPMLGVHQPREARALGSSGRSPNITWHSGAIMTSTATQAIFWGGKWSDSKFVNDKITGLDLFYLGVGSSLYANTNSEYTGTNGKVSSTISSLTHLVDTSTAPAKAPSTSAILGEVCKMVANPVPNGYYSVYVDTPRGSAGYCAWHSYGTCGTTPVQFGFFFNLDGDAGCDPQDSSNSHSQGLAALANVSGHELSEVLTDPRNGGWWDSSGEENADKCAWTFGAPLLKFTNASQWKIQGNWSNNAYNNGTGYPNSKGQKGCIDGH